MVRLEDPLLLAISISLFVSSLSPASLYQLSSGVGIPSAVHLKVAAVAAVPSFFVWHSGVTVTFSGNSGCCNQN